MYECTTTLLSGARENGVRDYLCHFHGEREVSSKSTASGKLLV